MDSTTLTLSKIVSDLDEHLDDLADAATDPDASDDEVSVIDQTGITVDQQLRAVEALADEYGAEETVEVSELAPGDRADFGELLAAARRQWEEQNGVKPGGEELRDIFWVAAGVTDAPWLSGDEDLQQRAAILRSPGEPTWHVIQYLKGKVTEVNSMATGNSKSYTERRQERAARSEPR